MTEEVEQKKEINTNKIKSIVKKPHNYWVIATLVLAIILLLVLFSNITGNTITGKAISSGNAAQAVLDFAQAQGLEADLVDISEKSGLYEVIISIDGQEVPVYITKDGEYFIPQAIPLSTQTQTPQTQEYSEQDIEKLSNFAECLAEKGVKIYGANWCGWTKKWVVETLGGFDTASPIYIECTEPENEEICSQEVESGFPTTKINGQVYTGARTIEAIAQETGCQAPELTGNPIDTSDSGDASCN